ncbi:MAG: NADP-dependent 3-hydroxy acid dehydrogenase YdfG [Candidatus Azotimanducaceae bacterium]|jgi:NADP-dependent 3-hydroxy acid dehydrogenase YdfG
MKKETAVASKTAFITGANRGIGRAISLKLAESGYNLVLLARNQEMLASVTTACRQHGTRVECFTGELRDEAFMGRAIGGALETFGAIDVLVNNAGAANMQRVQDADLAAWRDVMDVNFNAIVYLCRHILPQMVSRESGTIINISSLSGRNTSAGSAIYAASKHALNGFSGCLYEDVREFGIKVSTIMPGFVDTDLTENLGMTSKNMIQPQDVANCVAYVLSASPHSCPTEIVLRPQLRP